MNARHPAEVPLNTLHVALCKAADQYQHAATITSEPRVSAFLRELAEERQRMAEMLEEQIRSIGLPRMPNPEKEGLEKLLTTVKAALSPNQAASLLSDEEVLEQRIAEVATAALQEVLPEAIRRFVHGVAQRVMETQARFARFKPEQAGSD